MKKITAFTMGIFLLIGALSGCSDTESSVELVSIDELNAPTSISETPLTVNTESGTADSAQSAGNSLTEINIPQAAEYIEGTAEFALFEPEEVKKAFFGDSDITPEIIEHNDERHPHPIYTWEKDGMRLYINNNSICVDIDSAFTMMLSNLTSLPNYNYDGNMDEFEHNADELDFCTRVQAVKNVKEKLAEINVNVSENAKVYAICQGDLQKKIDERIAAEDLFDFNDYMKGEETKPLTSYTVDKSQECYIIVFNAEYNGVPVYNYQHYYLTIKDLAIFHPYVTAFYSANGIIGLSIEEYRAKITEDEKITTLISAETASEKAAEKYEDIAGIEDIAFDKVELMYVITPNYIDGKVNISKAKLIPAWVCTIRVTRNGQNKRTGKDEITVEKETVLIDARTGAEII